MMEVCMSPYQFKFFPERISIFLRLFLSSYGQFAKVSFANTLHTLSWRILWLHWFLESCLVNERLCLFRWLSN